MPLSTTATRTPAPVAPPQAHSGERSSSDTALSSRTMTDSREYAGRGAAGRTGWDGGWSATFEKRLEGSGDRGVPRRIGVGDVLKAGTELRGRGHGDGRLAARGQGHRADRREEGGELDIVEAERRASGLVDELERTDDGVARFARHAQHGRRPPAEGNGDAFGQSG